MKLFYLITFCTLVLIGCQNKKENPEFSELIEKQETEQENIALIKNLFNSFNDKDIDVFKHLSAPDYQYFFPSVSNSAQSREDMIKYLEKVFSTGTANNFDIRNIYAADNKVFVTYSFSGVHDGDLFDIPATGNEFNFSAILIYTIENGKITEVREEGNVVGLMTQLGMELKPKVQ